MVAHEWNNVILLEPRGHLREGAACDDLEHALVQWTLDGRRIVVDLSRVVSLTAHCIGVLAHAQEVARKHGGEVILCGATGIRRWLLSRTRLEDVVPIYDTPESALRALEHGPFKVA